MRHKKDNNGSQMEKSSQNKKLAENCNRSIKTAFEKFISEGAFPQGTEFPQVIPFLKAGEKSFD